MSQITEERTAAPEAASPSQDTGAWLRERVPGAWAAAVGVSWYVLGTAATLLEPHTEHDVPLIGAVLQVAMLAAVLVMIPGLIAVRRWGLVAAVGASVLFVAGAVACPTTGHHPIGLWWFGQMACTLALLAISVVALRQAPAARRPQPTSSTRP